MAKHKYIETPEIWKPIEDYNGYEVSNLGNVRSYRKRGCGWLSDKPHKVTGGKAGRDGSYLHFYASNENGRVKLLVHRCVANAFIENKENKPEVNHKDKNGHNNYVDNLEWVTSSENQLHARGENKYTPKVGRDRNRYRVYFRYNEKRTSKNFRTEKVAKAFAETVYQWQDQ